MTTMHSPWTLLPHPFSITVYGIEELKDDFVKSIALNGFLTAVDVTLTTIGGVEGYYILAGHTRVEAAKELKREVPIIIHKDQGELWQQNFILQSNKTREKTPEQKTREYTECLRIEQVLGERKRAAGERVIGTASERASLTVGLDNKVARQMSVIVQKADEGDPVAQERLKQINAGHITPGFVYSLIQPREVPAEVSHYDAIAARLQSTVGFFKVSYVMQAADPKHGFLFQKRFVCEEEAEAFIEMIAAIPEEARHKFAALSNSWRK